MFVRGTLLDNIRAPYWLLQEGWKIRRFVLLYHFFSTAYYARVNRTESSSSQKEFEDIVRSEGAIIISKRDRFPPDTEILRLNSKGWTFKEFKCSTEVYFFFHHPLAERRGKFALLCEIFYALDRCIGCERMITIYFAVYRFRLTVQQGSVPVYFLLIVVDTVREHFMYIQVTLDCGEGNNF